MNEESRSIKHSQREIAVFKQLKKIKSLWSRVNQKKILDSGVSKHRELTTGTCPVELLVASCSVIDHCSDFNVVLGALASLIGCGESP